MLPVIVCLLIFPMSRGAEADAFSMYQLEYVTRVEFPEKEDGKFEIWIPIPQENPYQKLEKIVVESPFTYKITEEPVYGNRMIYIAAQSLLQPIVIKSIFVVSRLQANGFLGMDKNPRMINPGLKSSRLIPVNPEIKRMSQNIIKTPTYTIDSAKKIYNHTLNHMTYDKSSQNWGNGDFQYACDIGKGNCTDFHSYFIGLLRNVNISSYFEIGFMIPPEKRSDSISGYHCWAYFLNKERWIPVDISEAEKNPEKINYFFGNLDKNRIGFSRGREILLNPVQRSGPLNYFIYPHAEFNGNKYAEISWQLKYTRLN